MKKKLLKILIKWVCYLLLLLIVGIDISFASIEEDEAYLWEYDRIAEFQKNHPYIFVTGLVLLPIGWIIFCNWTGLDSQLISKD
jgi:hypothetical protein